MRPPVTRVHGRMSGDPCMAGTRVPVEALFENLAAGMALDEILADYPTMDRGDAIAALRLACKLLAAAAPWVEDD